MDYWWLLVGKQRANLQQATVAPNETDEGGGVVIFIPTVMRMTARAQRGINAEQHPILHYPLHRPTKTFEIPN